MSIGNQIKKVRKARGLTQKQLADKAGVAEVTIRKYENGERQVSVAQLWNLAEVLEVSEDVLLELPPYNDINEQNNSINIEATLDAEWKNLENKIKNQTITDVEQQRYAQLLRQSTEAIKQIKPEVEARIVNIIKRSAVLPDDAIDDLMLFIEFLEMKADKERKKK